MDSSRQKQSLSFAASSVATVHTFLAFFAFISALVLGCCLHYKKIVKNGVAGYPQEWFPSVSATIGDWYPERSVFQILIAITSGPRFALVFLQYFLLEPTTSSKWPTFLFYTGVVRTLSCGGWVYITSTDDHDAHDILMILYILCNIPWMFGGILCTPSTNVRARTQRKRVAAIFFTSMVPMVYFFIQHKVHKVPGAYTRYSFFEWSLILLDVVYDSVTGIDFKEANLQIFITTEAKSTTQVNHKTTTTVPSKLNSEVTKRVDYGSQPTQGMGLISFVSDLYLSYIFWSIFTSLAPSFFYFSVWELAIAGHEASLMSTLSPCLLGILAFRRFAFTHAGKVVLSFLGFAGLVAYLCQDPLQKLGVVNFANACMCIRVVIDWSGQDVIYQGVVLGLGLIISSISKLANHSNNPVWPLVDEKSGGYNGIGLAIALLALLEFSVRPPRDIIPRTQVSQTQVPTGHWIGPALALGSLLFTLHNMLIDSSTLIAWSWTGYPVTGPVPHLHGCLTLTAQCLGLSLPASLSFRRSRILSHPLWFLYGAISAYTMYRYRDWVGYAGGINFSIFLMSILPTTLHQTAEAAKGRLGRTYFVVFLVVCLFYLASVWTVAYAFVPGGVYLRERTDLVLLAQLSLMSFVFIRNFPQIPMSTSSFPNWARSRIHMTLSLLSITSLLVTLYRRPVEPRPFKPARRIINAGIWTVHFGIDNGGRDSQRKMRDLFKDMELDIVGLLETDLHRIVYGSRDLTRVMVEELGYYVDVGPGPNSHTWGAVLLSKFPIIKSTHILLPSPDGELAPAIEAVLDIYGTEVSVVVSHNGQEETPLDRELQSIELARIMSESYPKPVIYLGYVVTTPHAPRPAPYEILATDGKVYDIDKFDLDRWCEYIFFRGLYRTAYARVSRGSVTDTELQIGQFVLPKHGYVVTNHTDEALYLRCPKEALPEDHWFPQEYYGEGLRGHFYHVFDEPLYYSLPEDAYVY